MTSLYEEVRGDQPGEVPVRRVSIRVNGVNRTADIEPRLLLAHFIRQGLRLTGTHVGCDTTNCGACTVLLDGKPAKSCTVLAVNKLRRMHSFARWQTSKKLHCVGGASRWS